MTAVSGRLLRSGQVVCSVGNIGSRIQGCSGVAVMGARVGRVAVGGPAIPAACPRASLLITGARHLLSAAGRRTSVGGEGSAIVRASDLGRLWRGARSDVAHHRNIVKRRLCAPSEGGGPKQGQWSARPQGKGTAPKTEFKRGVGGSGGGGGGGGAGKGGQGPDPGSAPPVGWELFLPPIILIAINMLSDSRGKRSSRILTTQFFLNDLLATGEVKRVDIDRETETVTVTLVDDADVSELGPNAGAMHYVVSVGSVDTFERQLENAQHELGLEERDFVPVRYVNHDALDMADIVSSILPVLFIASVYFVLSRRMRVIVSRTPGANKGKGGATGGNDPFSFGKMKKLAAAKPEETTTRFSDVAGLAEAKVEIKEFVDFLKQPDKFKTLGAKPPRGALLVGPPGTGKTLLAKAVAGEAGVPFYSVSGSDFVEIFVGVGASRVRDLFATARKTKPCIVYIDEIDAIGKARGNGKSGGGQERESTLNQLLVEMDGFKTESGVVIMASTNRADTLDKALLRPGRFDRQIACELPTLIERKQLFELHMKRLLLAPEVKADDVIPHLAALTPGMSGAQIASVCNEAALLAARRGGESVTIRDFWDAADRVIAGPEKRTRTIRDDERRIVAYHETGHVLVAWYLENVDPLLKTTIIPRASGALGFAQYLPSDRHLHSLAELNDRLAVMLGGRAAEQVQFGHVTTGASDDIKRCTEIAYAMLTKYGMSKNVGTLSWDDFPRPEGGAGYRSASNAFTEVVEREATELVRQAYLRAVSMLESHRDELVLVAEALLDKETLRYDDVEKLVGPRPFPHKHPYAIGDDGVASTGSSADGDGPETAGPLSGEGAGGGVAPAATTRLITDKPMQL